MSVTPINLFKSSTEKPIITVIDVPWYGEGSTAPDRKKSLESLVEASDQISLPDLDVVNAKQLGFGFIPADGHFSSEKTVLDVNGLIYNKTMNSLRQNQIPVILGGNNSISFAAIEAATKKAPMLDVVQISPHMHMKNNLQANQWDSTGVMFNVTARISNIGNVVQVGIRTYSEEEVQHCMNLNNARTDNIVMAGILSGMGKTYPKVYTHFEQELAREQFQGKTWLRLCNNIAAPLRQWTWISIDMKSFQSSSNVLDYNNIVFLLKTIVKTGHKIIGVDLVNTDNVNQEIVANLLFKASCFAAVSQELAHWQSKTRV